MSNLTVPKPEIGPFSSRSAIADSRYYRHQMTVPRMELTIALMLALPDFPAMDETAETFIFFHRRKNLKSGNCE